MIRISPLILLLSVASAAIGAEHPSLRTPVEGPVDARLISVVDGDTLLVEARPWPQQTVTVLVRIRGVDAPELRAKCSADRRAAVRAKQRLVDLARDRIRLTNVAGDKYFGRVVADVATNGGDVATSLLAAGLVSTYDGGRRTRACG